jgi:2-dehydro-3-deoxygalactonokinase
MRQNLWIALDGGTTNTRATLVQNDQIIDTVAESVGVRDSVQDQRSPVLDAVANCLKTLKERHTISADQVDVVASGMLGSDAGLMNVPHVLAPASANLVADSAVEWFDESVWPKPVRIFPGVRTGPDLNQPNFLEQSLAEDIMRGEETQAWGLWQMLLKDRPELVSRPWVLIWPGSHTKMIAMDAQGSILGSYTTLAGELFAALKSATLLRRSMSESGELEYSDEIVDLAARTVWEQGLVRAAFWTRVADVRGTLDANQRSAWLSSAVIGADVDALSKHPWVTGDAGIQIIVGGDKVRQSLYSRLLRQRLNCQIEVLESHYCEQAAAVGAVYLAKIRRQSGC